MTANSCRLMTAAWLVFISAFSTQADEKKETAAPTMVSRFAKDVDQELPWPEYPRPQLVRDHWLNLNGKWNYAITSKDADQINEWDGEILVPFCPESKLSGVQKRVRHDQHLWYHRTFQLPKDYSGKHILLHFGAVDWETTVWVNDQEVARHQGGFDPWSVDITAALNTESGAANDLTIRVWDPTDTKSQPRGKQVTRPHGIFYTPVTGIWQTVWIEPVNAAHISQLMITPDLDQNRFVVNATVAGNHENTKVQVTFRENNQVVAQASSDSNEEIAITIDSPKLWSPDSPHLYDVLVQLTQADGTVQDSVQSYAGMRKIDFRKDEHGLQRMFLNNEPLFHFGPLDQGFWPDGIFTPPTDEALKYDIEVTKQLGFNMARKHIKVEPARWYYWCDVLGLLVWQDMPSGAVFSTSDTLDTAKQLLPRDAAEDVPFTDEEAAIFQSELKAMIDHLRFFPSIVVWVPFNEGWGQHRTNDVLKWVKAYDPTRLVDGPSGWVDRGYGDLLDMHQYPGPGMFPAVDDRVSVLGEFGGLGLPLEGHTWLGKDNWGYRTFTTTEELRREYDKLIEQLPMLIAKGLAAAVYTQTTDVEVEVNGLMTYDREVIKFDPDHLRKIHAVVYAPPGSIKTVLPSAQQQPQEWSYTTEKPADGWEQLDFEAADWKTGLGGFGTEGTPNTTISTVWDSSEIWIRKELNLDEFPDGQLIIRVHHDDDVVIFLNGEKVIDKKGYERGYNSIPVKARLRQGKNVITAHCQQKGGGQYIDIGLDIFEAGKK